MKRLALVFLVVGVLLLSGCAPTRVSEPAIPAYYTTYTDKTGLFSISYPPKWELGLSVIDNTTQGSLGKTIFVAGKPYQDGYNPNLSIVVIPIDERNWKLEDFVENMVQMQNTMFKEYQELSRTKLVVDEREAVVIDSETQFPGFGSIRTLTMWTAPLWVDR